MAGVGLSACLSVCLSVWSSGTAEPSQDVPAPWFQGRRPSLTHPALPEVSRAVTYGLLTSCSSAFCADRPPAASGPEPFCPPQLPTALDAPAQASAWGPRGCRWAGGMV